MDKPEPIHVDIWEIESISIAKSKKYEDGIIEVTDDKGWTFAGMNVKDLHWDDLRLAAMINGATQIAVTKLDVKFAGTAGVRDYAKLTPESKKFIEKIEKELSVPVTLIGTGPDAKDIIDRRKDVL